MAFLLNTSGSVRFELMLADVETPTKAASQPAARRLLARAAFEHFDKSDNEFWPFVRLATIWVSVDESKEWIESLEALIRGESESAALRSRISDELGAQISRSEAGYDAEIGFDLHAFLERTSGLGDGAGDDLALFRFKTTQARLVTFASALKTELGELLSRG